MSDLHIFELGIKLAQLLNGDKEAIADIKVLYERHPEMFENISDVAKVIKEVVEEPKIAVDANREYQQDNKVIKVMKPLSDEKMGDVVISRNKDTNVIFHTNKKKISEFHRFVKKLDPKENLIDGEDAQSSHPNLKNQVGATGISSMRSSITESIIPQNKNQSQMNENKQNYLAKFTLCKSLVALLGEEKAIADLNLLYERHPEMFRDKEEIREVINEVVKEPDLIMKNPLFAKETEILVAKKLDNEKMGDVVIKNKNGTNIIFHANKKRIRDFERLQRIKEKIEADGGDAHTLHTAEQVYTGANVVSSTLSSATSNIIPQKDNKESQKEQTLVEASSAKAAPTRLDHYADKSSDLSRCNKALSMSAENIILQKSNQSQIFDMNDDSALKAIKSEMSSKEEKQVKENEAFKFNIRKNK